MIIHLCKDGLGYSFESVLTDDYPEEVNTFCDRTTKQSAWELFIKYLNHSSILIEEKKRKRERQANEKAVETLSGSMCAMYGANPQTYDGSWDKEARQKLAELGHPAIDRDRLNKWLSAPPHTPFTGFKKQ